VLRPGIHHLVVRTADGRGRRDFDDVRFVVARRRPSLLSLTASNAVAAAARATRGPLAVTLRLARGVDRAVLRLNGHRVDLGSVAGRLRVRLSADDGLRFGRNRLRVRAHREAGEWDVERRLIVVRRSHPLAAAGRDRTVRGRGSIRLDATGSLPAGRGTDLGYSWRVLRRPEGSRARLSSAPSARPRLRVDRPGRYQVAVTVSEGNRRARDEMTVVGQPDYPPIGAAFDTAAWVDGKLAVRIGSQTYPYPQGDRFNKNPPFLLVLDRRSLEVVASEWIPVVVGSYQMYLEKISALAGRAAQERTQYLAIVAVPPNLLVGGFPVGGYSRIDRLTWDPNNPTTDAGRIDNDGGQLPTDTGHGQQGGMTGYLQLDNQGYYTPVQTPFYDFSTGVRRSSISPDNTEAFFNVGEASYTVCSLNYPRDGTAFAVLALEERTLKRVGGAGGCFVVNTGDNNRDLQQQETMVESLRQLHDAGHLVFIQSIGNPRPTTPTWGRIAAAIESLGGSAHIFNTLNGTGPYALVGCGLRKIWDTVAVDACSWPEAVESSYPEMRSRGAGTLSGTLGPDQNSRWVPIVADPGAGLNYGLLRLAYQPPSPWPYMDTAGRRAAYAWIWAHAKSDSGAAEILKKPGDDWCRRIDDLRAAYCSDTVPMDEVRSWLRGLDNSDVSRSGGKDADGNPFTAQDFKDVQQELLRELAYRDTVRSIIGLLKAPFVLASGDNQLQVKDVADKIKLSLAQPPAGDALLAVNTVLSTMLGVVSSFPDPPAWAAAAGTVGTFLAAAGELAVSGDGQPVFNVDVAADELGWQMANRLVTVVATLDRIKQVILSDGGKLEAVATRFGLNDSQMDSLVPPLRLATRQWLWQELLPRAWGLFKFAAPPRGKRINDLVCERWNRPFQDISDGASWTPIVGFGIEGIQTEWHAPANMTNIWSDQFRTPGGALYENLWQPASDSDVTRAGMDKPWFYRRAEGKWQWMNDDRSDGQTPFNGDCKY
jgi:hypothetical protein